MQQQQKNKISVKKGRKLASLYRMMKIMLNITKYKAVLEK
jgi:hypothetical protein